MTFEAIVQQVSAESISSTNSKVLDINLTTVPKDFDSFQSEIELTMLRETRVNALVGWFDVEMTPGVWMSTSPF